MRTPAVISSMAAILLLWTGAAQAVPILQLYVEGGSYDSATETWVLTPTGSSGGTPFRVWAIGQIVTKKDEPQIIHNVRLSVAFLGLDISGDTPDFTITVTPSQAGGLGVGDYCGISDPSVPDLPTLNTEVDTSLGMFPTAADGLVTNGGTPVLGDGSDLPAHGVFGEGVVWQEYLLGDFTQTDSPIGDFVGAFPDELSKVGQINVYEVSVTGLSGVALHFDLYDSVAADNGAVFAPFSHDADGETNIAPEPASVFVWLLMGLTWAGSAWRFQYRRRWQKWQKEEAAETSLSDSANPDALAGSTEAGDSDSARSTGMGEAANK